MKKYLALVVVVIVVLSCSVFAASFSDLTSEHWAYKPISDMTAKGILSGYPDGSFKPNQSITRAEFAKIMVSTLNLTSNSANSVQFKDVTTEHWAYNYISVASNYLTGYQNGSEYLYMPDSAAVREDMALAIVRAMGLSNSEYKNETLNKFSDKDLISENLKKYVAIAVENGLMKGNANGTFNPKGNLTRAEVCQLMLNALDNLEKVAINQKDNEVKLSANKLDGATLKDSDSIKLSASNLGNKIGSLDYRIYFKGDLLLPGSFKDGDSINVKEIIKNAENKKIDLYGKEIMLELFFDNVQENKSEGKVTYSYKIASKNAEQKEVKLSADKKDGATLNETDSIKLSASNYENKQGTLDYRVYYNDEMLLPGSFKNGDSIKVKEIIDYAKNKKIDLYGKEITVTLLFDNLANNKTEGTVTYNYKIAAKEAEQKEIKLSADKKDGTTLKESDSIRLSASNYAGKQGSLDYRVFYNGKLLMPGSFKNGDSLKVKDIIDYAKKENIYLYGKEIRVTLFFDNVSENKAEGEVTYTYKIEQKIVPIKDALVEAQLEGETLESDFDKGLYTEFFVKYNRPLKEAKVEAKDQNGKTVSLVDARVATEHEDDAVKNDISTVRIRIKFEYGKRYTFTVKDVIDKEGNKIENYSFKVTTIVPIKDALVEAQLDGKTIEPTGNAKYYESFVIYNRPLKQAKVEVRNAFDEVVSNVEGKVATEYEDDAVKNDISSVRIRMKYARNDRYTITVKDVVDKDGFKIEDYSFIVKVSK